METQLVCLLYVILLFFFILSVLMTLMCPSGKLMLMLTGSYSIFSSAVIRNLLLWIARRKNVVMIINCFRRRRKRKVFSHICVGNPFLYSLSACFPGHLSRLLNRRRKKKGATTAPESQIMHPPLQKNLNHLQDDWPEWTCFTIELEVHPLLEGSSE